MNKIFLSGYVASDINYDFILNSKKSAIARFKIKVENKQFFEIEAFDLLADFCYRSLKLNDYIMIYGSINQNMNIYLYEINVFQDKQKK